MGGGNHGLRRNSETREETVERGEGERVHAAVVRRSERERPRRRHEGVERLGGRERAVGHDHERSRPRTGIAERERDRVRMAASVVDEDSDSRGGESRVGRDE